MTPISIPNLKPGRVYYDTPDIETCEAVRFLELTKETVTFEAVRDCSYGKTGDRIEFWRTGTYYTMDRIENLKWRMLNGDWFTIDQIMDILGVERAGAYWHTRELDKRRCEDRSRGVWEYGYDKSHSFS